MVETRDLGCALVIGEVQAQIGALATIIPDGQGQPLGALSMSMLKERIRDREDWLAEMLSMEVGIIRASLGNDNGRKNRAAAKR